MYTANTLASAAEALGMTLPGSSSFPAEYQEKQAECESIGDAMRNLLEKNILPRDIMTRSAFENAIVRSVLMSLRTKGWLTLSRLAGTDHDLGRLD
jgi:dihydroxy-acid dehydratase